MWKKSLNTNFQSLRKIEIKKIGHWKVTVYPFGASESINSKAHWILASPKPYCHKDTFCIKLDFFYIKLKVSNEMNEITMLYLNKWKYNLQK